MQAPIALTVLALCLAFAGASKIVASGQERSLFRLHTAEGSSTELDRLQQTVTDLSAKLTTLEAKAASRRVGITPELAPTSDKKFFKQDYPNDNRPAVHAQFDHPYPTVQDSEDYDKDYVKDENNDGGEWKAQENYDRLVNKMHKEKADIQEALEKEQKEEEDVESAKEREAAAEKKAKEEEGKAGAARNKAKEDAAKADAAGKKAEDIEADANKTAGGTGGNGTAIENQAGDVEKEMTDLEKCKEQLVKARGELEKKLKEKEMREADKAASELDEEFAKEKEASTEKTEENLEDKLAGEEKEHDAALKDWKSEEADVKETEADLKKAADNLRRFRKNVDPDGGVYNSDAMLSASPMLGFMLLAAAFLR